MRLTARSSSAGVRLGAAAFPWERPRRAVWRGVGGQVPNVSEAACWRRGEEARGSTAAEAVEGEAEGSLSGESEECPREMEALWGQSGRMEPAAALAAKSPRAGEWMAGQ